MSQVHINETVNYYAILMESNPLSRYTAALMATVLIIILIPLLYSIIWYEKYGANNRQTIINQFLSTLCWNSIIWHSTVQMTSVIRHIYGPLNNDLCLVTLFTRRTLVTNILLLLNAISALRYLFIFKLKNVSAFPDDFWFRFVSRWIICFSILLQSVNAFLPGQKPIFTKICAGHPPEQSPGVPSSMYGVEIPTAFLQILVLTRIKLYKRRNRGNEVNHVNDLDNKSIMSTASSMLLIILVFTAFGISIAGSVMPPQKLIVFPFSVLFHYSGLLFPCLLTLIFVSFLYAKNPHMKSCVSRELAEFITCMVGTLEKKLPSFIVGFCRKFR